MECVSIAWIGFGLGILCIALSVFVLYRTANYPFVVTETCRYEASKKENEYD